MGWTKIWDYTSEPGKMSIAVLGDRAIITDGQADPPLVFMGCMQATQVDWAYPKNVMVSQDGFNYYDITSYVCDQDSDTVAEVGGVRDWGRLLVTTDVPTIEGFYIEVGTPNTGNSTDESQRTTIELDEDVWTPVSYKRDIAYWKQESGATGHFESAEYSIDDAAAVDKGGGDVGIPITGHALVTNDVVRLYSTTNYNSSYTVKSYTANEIVITAAYVAETFSGSKYRKHIVVGATDSQPTVGSICTIGGTDYGIMTITGSGTGVAEVELSDTRTSATVAEIVKLEQGTNGPAVTSASEESTGTIFDKSAQATTNHNGGGSIRQVILGASLSQAGVSSARIYLNIPTNTYAPVYNLIKAVSIGVQSSGTNTTATPTPVYFNGAVAPTSSGEHISDPISIELRTDQNYVVTVDLDSSQTTQTSQNNVTKTITNPAYAQWEASKPVFTGSYLTLQVQGASYPAWQEYNNALIAWNAAKPSPTLTVTETSYVTRTYDIPAITLYADTGNTYYWRGSDFESASSSTVTGFSTLSGQSFVKKIVADTTASVRVGGMAVGYMDTEDMFDPTGIDSITKIETADYSQGSSTIFHLVTFNSGSTYKTFVTATGWVEVVKFDSVWKYWNGSSWVAATHNSLGIALSDAMSVAANQMTSAELEALVESDITDTGGYEGADNAYIGFAWGIEDVGANPAYVGSYSVYWGDAGSFVIEKMVNGVWTADSAWTNNTEAGGISLAQSGTIVHATSATTEYSTVDNVPGFNWRLKIRGTSAGTTVSRVMYKADCQHLQVIGDGQPDIPSGFVFYDDSTNQTYDYTVEVSDNTLTSFSKADIPMAVGDYLYIGYPLTFNELEIVPYVVNTSAAVLSGEYWNGESWYSLYIADGTIDGSKCLTTTGKIKWTTPDDWRMNIPFQSFLSRAYWIRLTPSASLSTTTSIAELRIYSVPEELRKYKFAEVFENRLALAARPDQLSQVDITRPFEEYGMVGSNSGSFIVGGPGSVTCMVSAWNGLFVGKPEVWNQMKADGTGSYKFELVEAARSAPLNNQVIVKAPVQGFEAGDKYGLFFLNRYGAFVNTGMHTDSIFDTQKAKMISVPVNWWSGRTTDTPRLDLDNLHIACGVYWPVKNWVMWSVPMILSGSTPQTTNNRVIVYDLNIQNWLPPFSITAASMCTAYHYDSTAPGKLGQLGLYAGTYSGTVVRLFEPEVYTESGSNVAAYLETGWLHFGEPETEKELREFWVFGQTLGTNITLTVYTRSWVKTGQVSDTVTKTYTDLTNAGDICGMAFEGGEAAIGNFIKIRLDWSGKTDILGISLGILGLRNYPAT